MLNLDLPIICFRDISITLLAWLYTGGRDLCNHHQPSRGHEKPMKTMFICRTLSLESIHLYIQLFKLLTT